MAIIERARKFFEFWYYQYILHTGLYMLESWERGVFTSLVVAFIAMASYTTYIFLPRHIAMIQFLLGYVTNTDAMLPEDDLDSAT